MSLCCNKTWCMPLHAAVLSNVNLMNQIYEALFVEQRAIGILHAQTSCLLCCLDGGPLGKLELLSMPQFSKLVRNAFITDKTGHSSTHKPRASFAAWTAGP